MKVVAITQRVMENESYAETRDCLDVRWAGLFARLDLVPLVLPTTYDPATLFARFAPEGLVLTGGNDLSSISPAPLSVMRDRFERRVLELALEQSLPVFAVCRGMQLVAEYFGAPIEKVEGHVGVRHAVTIDRGSRFGKLLGALETVNSYHGYAPTVVPQGFREVANAGGAIEAIEHASLPIYCQMWHPEREAALTEGEGAAIRALFAMES